MRDLRIKVRAIILSITGFIAALLVIRIFLDIIDASSANSLVELIRDITDFFIEPFKGIVTTNIESNMNWDAFVALLMIVLIGILISEIVTAFLYERVSDIIQNVVDTIFKVIEFFIFLRLIFDFFRIENTNGFINTVYSLTDWTRGITDATFLNGRLYWSTLIVLIIVAFLDVVTESLLNSLFKQLNLGTKKTVVKQTVVAPQPVHTNTIYAPGPVPVQPTKQVINIHVPPTAVQQVPPRNNNG